MSVTCHGAWEFRIARPLGLRKSVCDPKQFCVSVVVITATLMMTSRRRYSLPFLNAYLSALNLFSVEFQALAHRIRGQLLILNQEVDITWLYFHI